VQVRTATSPGHGRPNEDFVGAASGVAVLLDGVGIPGTERLCRHGVAWYAHTLGAELLDGLSRGAGPVDALADAIGSVAGRHRDTCDLSDPSSPQATVAVLRIADGRADFLVLADAFVVLAPRDGVPRVLTDPRDVEVNRECSSLLDGLAEGTADYQRAYRAAGEALRARRNRPGGYWIAKDDPGVAAEAVTGSVSLRDLAGVGLLSNGAARAVDPYRLAGWPAVVGLLRTGGPDALVDRIRRAEAAALAGTMPLPGFVSPDDATAAWCALGSRTQSARDRSDVR
jgi:hypothetical protein